MLVHQSFKYRLVLNHTQEAALTETLARCRELYNAALWERREAYRLRGQTLTLAHQSAELPAVKVERPEYRNVFSQTLQDVLHRLDRAYQSFFRRVKAGEKPGFPRFQGPGLYDSFTYPQYGNGVTLEYDGGKWGTLTLSKLGSFKVRIHRAVQGQIKTVTIRRDGEQWYVSFSCLVEAAPLPETDTATGVDLGLLHFATLADGSTIENPRPLRRGLRKLKQAQQHLARCKRGSQRRARAKRTVTRLHRKVRNQRADFCHKAARHLVNTYGTVVFENLQVRNMAQNHRLALSIRHAGGASSWRAVSSRLRAPGGRYCSWTPAIVANAVAAVGTAKSSPWPSGGSPVASVASNWTGTTTPRATSTGRDAPHTLTDV